MDLSWCETEWCVKDGRRLVVQVKAACVQRTPGCQLSKLSVVPAAISQHAIAQYLGALILAKHCEICQPCSDCVTDTLIVQCRHNHQGTAGGLHRVE
jgi:hypothetical protein